MPPEEQEDPSDIPSFLTREGGVALLTQIDYNEGMLFSELQEQVHVSQTTLSKRKDEALQMKLLTREPRPDDHGNAERYKLTRRGKKLRSELNDRDIPDSYRKFFDHYVELGERRDEVAEWVDETVIVDPDWPYDDEPAHDYYED